jgi:hypothetical protein
MSIKQFSSFLFAGILSVFIISCQNDNKAATDKKNEVTENDSTKNVSKDTIHSKYNEIARLIAGLDSLPKFKEVKNRKAFVALYDSVNLKFKKIEESRLSKITAWSKDILTKEKLSDNNFCFYPFAGGDFLHANFLYPNASEYLMFALEPVGSLPDFQNYKEEEILAYLSNLDNVLRNIYSNSYFITKNMNEDIGRRKVDGMLPLIVWGAAKSGYDISSLRYFNVDSLGEMVFVADTSKNIRKAKGVYIEILKNGQKKTLRYLSCDVANDAFAKNASAKKFLEKNVPQGKTTSFIKSASYLLHYDLFSEVRNIVLGKSTIIFQDDTGIPYRLIKNTDWKIKLYGEYKVPIKDFSSNLFQKDLDADYVKKVNYEGALPFSLGYHWKTGSQNQMVFFKTK